MSEIDSILSLERYLHWESTEKSLMGAQIWDVDSNIHPGSTESLVKTFTARNRRLTARFCVSTTWRHTTRPYHLVVLILMRENYYLYIYLCENRKKVDPSDDRDSTPTMMDSTTDSSIIQRHFTTRWQIPKIFFDCVLVDSSRRPVQLGNVVYPSGPVNDPDPQPSLTPAQNRPTFQWHYKDETDARSTFSILRDANARLKLEKPIGNRLCRPQRKRSWITQPACHHVSDKAGRI